MKNALLTQSIELFGLALEGQNYSYEKILKLGLSLGYIIDKRCSTLDVYEFLKSKNVNTSSTFYKDLEEVIEKDRFELFLDQVLHYSSTYGTNREGTPYIPNEDFYKNKEEEILKKDLEELKKINFKEYKYIMPATQEEIIKRCEGLLSSGIALKGETIGKILAIYNIFFVLPNMSVIKNKEIKMFIYDRTDVLPPVEDGVEEFVRFLVYKATNKTLLIKSKEVLMEIESSSKSIKDEIEKYGIKEVASCFYRFKPIFLAFRKANKENRKIINKVRKLAKKYHVPTEGGFWSDVLKNKEKAELISKKIKDLSTFKIISLLETQMNTDSEYRFFTVRNGKVFIKERNQVEEKVDNDINSQDNIVENKLENENKNKEKDKDKKESEYVFNKDNLLNSPFLKELIKRIKKNNKKTYYMSDFLSFTLPRSEKTFIENFPMGTKVKLKNNEHIIVGINWESGKKINGEFVEDCDFDLSYIDEEGVKVGWNSNYKKTDNKNRIIYSGDLTTGDPEATELIYFEKGIDGSVSVNLYDGDLGSKFIFFVAVKDCADEIKKNYKVPAESIVFSSEIVMDKKQKTLGTIVEDGFIIQNMITGNHTVSGGDTITKAFIKHNKNYSFLELKTILDLAGLEKVDNKDEADLVFTSDTKKDDIIKLLDGSYYTDEEETKTTNNDNDDNDNDNNSNNNDNDSIDIAYTYFHDVFLSNLRSIREKADE